MIRLTSLVLGLAVLAGSAQAADYKVSLANKSPAEVKAAIYVAAAKACRDAYSDDFDPLFDVKDCISDTVAATRAQLPSIYAINTLDLADKTERH